MRLLALILLGLGGLATTASAGKAPSGTFETKDARGSVQIVGERVILGHIDKGSLRIVDLTPTDQWSPWVNGVPRGKVVWLKGKNISFRISAGRYRIVANGEGISVSARGIGAAILNGEPDAVGEMGSFRVGDESFVPMPDEATKITFGKDELTTSSSRSGKIQ
jgi:hypothetical protein